MRLFVHAILMAALAAAAPASAATVLTGDRVEGTAVIDRLDVTDLSAGQTTRFYFRASDQLLGQAWYVPVIIIKGAKPGPRLLITAGIHGDELNGIAVIQKLVGQIDPAQLKGVVVAVPGVNTPGLLHSTRAFTPDVDEGGGDNLNRSMPGDMNGDDLAKVYAAHLWTRLLKPNADLVVDMHTQSHRETYPMYVFAKTAASRRMGNSVQPDVINMNSGAEGSIETTMDDAGVPAITLELGGPEVFDAVLIDRATRGLRNLMIDQGMLVGAPLPPGPPPFVGNDTLDIGSPRGGYAHLTVGLGDDVKAGQAIATVTNAFGDVLARVVSPESGHVLSIATDPRRDQGEMLVRLIRWSETGVCHQDGCPADAKPPRN